MKDQKHNIEKEESGVSRIWNSIIDSVIYPPVKSYKESEIGTDSLKHSSKTFLKKDHSVPHAKRTLNLTVYSLKEQVKSVIVYLHMNCSNKVQCKYLLEYLPEDVGLGCFDFLGCGLNNVEGVDKVTMGAKEAEQAASVVDYLKDKGYRVGVWGRSMGASTALLFGQAQAIISDSPYFNFKSATSRASKYILPCLFRPFVACFFPCIFYKMRKDLKERADFDVDELDMMKAVPKIKEDTLLILMAGKEDQLITYQDLNQIFWKFKGKKKHLIMFQGNHDAKRPAEVLTRIMALVCDKFKSIEPKSSLDSQKNFLFESVRTETYIK